MGSSEIEICYHEAGHSIIAEHYGRTVYPTEFDLNDPKVLVKSLKLENIDFDAPEDYDWYIENLQKDISILLAARISEYRIKNNPYSANIFYQHLPFNYTSIPEKIDDELMIVLKLNMLDKLHRLKSIEYDKHSDFIRLYNECLDLIYSEKIWKEIIKKANELLKK